MHKIDENRIVRLSSIATVFALFLGTFLVLVRIFSFSSEQPKTNNVAAGHGGGRQTASFKGNNQKSVQVNSENDPDQSPKNPADPPK